MSEEYDHRNCQSLFGYAREVHKRSRGVCQLCGYGKGPEVEFDLWRQLTVEHLIGESQGGDLKQIREAITRWFPSLSPTERERLAKRIHGANTVTACNFCNSASSRYRFSKGMTQLISEAEGAPDQVVNVIGRELCKVLEHKRADMQWKLKSVRGAFEKHVKPELRRGNAE